MIQKKYLYIFLCFAWGLFFPKEARAGGWEWKLGSECGYFHAGDNLNLNKIRYIAALSGSARFAHTQDLKNTYLLQLRLRPELYGPQGGNYTLTSSATAQYQRRWSVFDFNAGGTARRQYYALHTDHLNVIIFQLFSSVWWHFAERKSVEMEGRYCNAVVSGDTKNAISATSLTSRLRYSFSNYGSISAGVLTESFFAKTNDILFFNRSDHGWRAGPELNLEYSRNWLISIHYLPSGRYSNQSNEVHTEHEINIVAGKNLNTHWAVFFLADYYIRDIDSSTNNLVYTQANYENRVHAKLVYSWEKNYSIYFKLAYTKNELFNEKTAFSGTQASIGFEIKR